MSIYSSDNDSDNMKNVEKRDFSSGSSSEEDITDEEVPEHGKIFIAFINYLKNKDTTIKTNKCFF